MCWALRRHIQAKINTLEYEPAIHVLWIETRTTCVYLDSETTYISIDLYMS